MLDLQKVTHALKQIDTSAKRPTSLSIQTLVTLWSHIANDSGFLSKLDKPPVNWLIPRWHTKLTTTHTVTTIHNYQILGIDGSQIYPDRHQGTDLFLINVGAIYLSYNQASQAALYNDPVIIHPNMDDFQYTVHSQELINCLRQAYELNAAITLSGNSFDFDTTPYLVLFDGSLIFWQLEGKQPEIKELFLDRYLRSFEQLYQANIPYISYISAPYSKELINIIRLYGLLYPECGITDQDLTGFFDADLIHGYVNQTCYTLPFVSTSHILQEYPAHLRINFIYIVTAYEVARIEFPAWLTTRIHDLIGIIFDQVEKGFGYPVACAEAHEQAVVKIADKELFYAVLRNLSKQKSFFKSNKLVRKQTGLL